jgi:hypothetical protein
MELLYLYAGLYGKSLYVVLFKEKCGTDFSSLREWNHVNMRLVLR